MDPTYIQYADYIKPDWAPPAWLFGPVWTILYCIIALTFGYMVYKWWQGEIEWKALLPFGLNLFFNLIFTPIQFGLMSMELAALDIVLVLGTLVWIIVSTWKRYKWVAIANTPYLAWVSFATVLQFTILWLNRG